jgi:DNA helicase-2/ATP-dependent DNA helicase PcrA
VPSTYCSKLTPNDRILDARVIDFKAMEGGIDPETNEKLHWTELSLQVQLYAKAATEVLGENARTGAVHLLKDNKRVDVPISDEAVRAAVANIEWAVDRILAGEFPMRPQHEKCEACDFRLLCPKRAESFSAQSQPPPWDDGNKDGACI